MTTLCDNARVEMDGLVSRAICDRLRTAITEAADEHGAYLRFSTEAGDLLANEAKTYAGRLQAVLLNATGRTIIPRKGAPLKRQILNMS